VGPSPSRGARSTAATLVVSLVALVGLATAVDAQDHRGADARAERERVRDQRAQLALQVDALEADDGALDQALRDIDENLRGQQALLADAERAAREAEQRSVEARASADAKAAELDVLQERMTQIAVDSYVSPPGNDVLDRLKADTATDAAKKHALLAARTTRASDVADQLRAARSEFERDRNRAEQAKTVAEERHREAQRRTIELQQAKAVQTQFSDQLEARLNAKLAEAGALATIDTRLSAMIAAEQAALAQRLRALAPAAATGGGGAGPSRPPPPSVAPVPLSTVRGITVHSSLAGRLESLLAAASADGVVLSGTGYRDPARQIALRRDHCGPSYYEIYEMPPFLCTPPTAIPGSSLHEQGRAIDFTWNGKSITTRDNAGFIWLAANAARFGFYNLPSEPWHWSVSGS